MYGSDESRRKGEVFLKACTVLAASSSALIGDRNIVLWFCDSSSRFLDWRAAVVAAVFGKFRLPKIDFLKIDISKRVANEISAKSRWLQ